MRTLFCASRITWVNSYNAHTMFLSRIGSVCAYFALARAWKHEALSIERDLSGAPLGYRGGLPESKLSNHSRRSDHSSHSDHSERSDYSKHSMRSVELCPMMSKIRPKAAKMGQCPEDFSPCGGQSRSAQHAHACVCARDARGAHASGGGSVRVRVSSALRAR